MAKVGSQFVKNLRRQNTLPTGGWGVPGGFLGPEAKALEALRKRRVAKKRAKKAPNYIQGYEGGTL